VTVPVLALSDIPEGDVLFAGVEPGEEYPREKGRRFRLIQGGGPRPGYPKWEAAVRNAWVDPAPKIVIARWLYEEGLKLGVPPDQMAYIPNGIDHSKWRILSPINDRPPRVAMMYQPHLSKGAKDGIEALELCRREFSSLRAVVFGKTPRPTDLPDWIDYHQDPPADVLLGRIYNGSTIYLCPSWTEGWHLPPAEAMACGCAVVSTDIGGVRDYAHHEVTALLAPPRNPEALARALIRLLSDDPYRIGIAEAGHKYIRQFTWERSTDLLESFIMGMPANRTTAAAGLVAQFSPVAGAAKPSVTAMHQP
jgi:glycosyltransferase involved in cell wall biosynthesis